jgi:FAD:protein FMN transferase
MDLTHHLAIPTLLLAAAGGLMTPSSCEAKERFTFSQRLMGTSFRVICHAMDHAAASEAAHAAFSIAEEVNSAASDYLPESELSVLSSKPVGEPIPLSPLLYDLLAHSRHLAGATGGAFDPTLGPMTKLWRETRASGRLPDPDTLAAARAATGWRDFTLDPEARTLTLHRRNMAFDLGGIAKGYAADLMLETLAAAGIRQALVTAGGDIRMGDPPPGREGWRIALKTLDADQHDDVLVLSNAAVSTSGDLHQSVEIEGVGYSHILDPATGLGLTRRVAASVIAAEAKLSDPLATAACVLGPDGSGALRNFPGVRDIRMRTAQETAADDSKTCP